MAGFDFEGRGRGCGCGRRFGEGWAPRAGGEAATGEDRVVQDRTRVGWGEEKAKAKRKRNATQLERLPASGK